MRRMSLSCGAVGLGETPPKVTKEEEYKEKTVGSCSEVVNELEELSVTGDSSSKRANYLSWTDYFMAVACLSAQRSKDPSTQVGACIVNEEKKIVGIGYNGMPTGCPDEDLPWGKEPGGGFLDNKYPYVCHAEMNAIMNKNSSDVKNCTMYVALFPCNECAKLILQSGIRKVVFMRDKPEKEQMQASKRMFNLAGVIYEQYRPETRQITIHLSGEGACEILGEGEITTEDKKC